MGKPFGSDFMLEAESQKGKRKPLHKIISGENCT